VISALLYVLPANQHKKKADERTPTADLISLRVIGHALQGFAQGCKYRISKRLSLLRFAACCTVLRSRWYQSGIKRAPLMHRGRYPRRALFRVKSGVLSHSYPLNTVVCLYSRENYRGQALWEGHLELPPIGWQLFIRGSSQSDSTAFPSFLATYATRLLAEALKRRVPGSRCRVTLSARMAASARRFLSRCVAPAHGRASERSLRSSSALVGQTARHPA
jgi:hypothetical protein